MRKSLLLIIALFGLLIFSQKSLSQMPVLAINNRVDSNVYLECLDIDVKITGHIASTTMKMVFRNKTERILEGELVLPLPENSSVSGYALDINGKMREAVPIEKAKATQTFESIELRKVDPGLLEKVAGNNFRTRIYPVPPYGTRTIKISYEQELIPKQSNGISYHLPLHFKKAVDKFRLYITVVKSSFKPVVVQRPAGFQFEDWNNMYTASIEKTNFIPARSLTIEIPLFTDAHEVMPASVWMQKKGNGFYFLVNTFPKYTRRKKSAPKEITIIWDASLSSMNRNIAVELELLDRYFRAIENVEVNLALIYTSFEKVNKFHIRNGNWTVLKKAIEKIVYDGGTNLGEIKLNDFAGDEYFLFSDGLSTFGTAAFALNGKPVHTINSSPALDDSGLKLIAQKSGGSFINLDNTGIKEAVRALLEEPFRFMGVKKNDGINEIYPSIPTPVVTNFSLAGITSSPKEAITLQFGFGEDVTMEKTVVLDPAFYMVDSSVNIPRHWAQKKIAELDMQFEKNKEFISALGKRYSIVTRNTSLIVLETVSDYVQYEIEPPTELRQEYDQLVKQRNTNSKNEEESFLSEALTAMNSLRQWWDKDFIPAPPTIEPVQDTITSMATQMALTRDTMVVARDEEKSEAGDTLTGAQKNTSNHLLQEVIVTAIGTTRKRSLTASYSTVSSDALVNTLQGRVAGVSVTTGNTILRGMSSSAWESAGQNKNPDIVVREWTPDREYLDKIKKTKRAHQFHLYVVLRKKYLNTPSFYYDMACFFFRQKDSVTGLRILSNIAELQFEDHELYKLLGFTLKQLGASKEALYIFGKVLSWRPQEPQSYRDYGLALADAGQYQQALDTLYAAITKAYATDTKDIFFGIEEIIITEINHLVSSQNNKLDQSEIDTTLLHAMPVDIRVVLNWNTKDTDIDLWVTDPNGEKSYFSHKSTSGGGKLSEDQTNGYGPEQFLLKKAVSGKYKIEVDYFTETQFKLSGPTTLMVEIYTHYGDNREQRKILTLQMSEEEEKEGILVGEFDF